MKFEFQDFHFDILNSMEQITYTVFLTIPSSITPTLVCHFKEIIMHSSIEDLMWTTTTACFALLPHWLDAPGRPAYSRPPRHSQFGSLARLD